MNNILDISIQAGLAYGAAYVGKAYFQVNPSHTIIFTLATFALVRRLNMNNIFDISIKTGLVYGAAYVGKAYFQVNPSHAAIFALTSLILTHLGTMLSQRIDETNLKYRLSSQTKLNLKTISIKVGTYISPLLAISFRFFSPHQTIAALALNTLCADAYNTTKSLLPKSLLPLWAR